ncbi:MAG TPA: hypothetical protein VKV32_18235, partial [Stellaceae bacterium]|nr:hypothetical protein [Stellaceae bacterium]
RNRSDEFIGSLVNAYIASGGRAFGVKAGQSYVDVGTFNGYRAAMELLAETREAPPSWRGARETLVPQRGEVRP